MRINGINGINGMTGIKEAGGARGQGSRRGSCWGVRVEMSIDRKDIYIRAVKQYIFGWGALEVLLEWEQLRIVHGIVLERFRNSSNAITVQDPVTTSDFPKSNTRCAWRLRITWCIPCQEFCRIWRQLTTRRVGFISRSQLHSAITESFVKEKLGMEVGQRWVVHGRAR